MVRAELRGGDDHSYTPHNVTIGPYHRNHQTQEARQAERVKHGCVELIIKEVMEEGSTRVDLERVVEPLVADVMKWYDDHLRVGAMTPVEWSTMVLLDGCYLLVSAVDYKRGNNVSSNNGAPTSASRTRNDNVTSASAALTGNAVGQRCSKEETNVVRDTVFLLENQIPFFVLETIHGHITRGRGNNRPLLENLEVYIIKQLKQMLYISPRGPRTLPPLRPPSHLLQLVHTYFESPAVHQKRRRTRCRCCCCQTGEDDTEASQQPPGRTGRWRRATEYFKYGNVRFKRRVFKEEEEWTILDVRLQGGTLWVPLLQVDGMTWTVLRNLMALEEQESRAHRPITAYCVFMSQMACKEEDVELLQRQGILEQFMGNDEEVAEAFADLCKGLVFDVNSPERNYLRPIWHEMHNLCNYPRNFMGSFRHRYCSDPLYLTTFVVAGFLFFFQLAQVILTLIPLVQTNKH
ncbi:unnamed protein product [Urochloa humidicola]